MSHIRYDVQDKPPLGAWIPLSLQHVFAMFGATVLVPLITGLSPATALLTSGLGTLLYIAITKGKVPAYLGSSFAFIAPIIAVAATHGMPAVFGASIVVGLFYVVIALIIRLAGLGWLDKVLPPVVIGSVIIVIGMSLAPVAMKMAMHGTGDASTPYSLANLAVAGFTLGLAVVSAIVLRGFFTVIPILIAIVGGYLFALFMGFFFPAFQIINFSALASGEILRLPSLVMPVFNPVAIITFLLVSFATIAEHLGDTLVTSRVVGRNFVKDPGIHRTMMGDGLATSLAGVLGGPPNTTYGENIGVMAFTHVYSVWVIGGAAVIAVILSFFAPVGNFISTIPGAVMGGVSMMLFGIIASSGIRTLVESGVDYTCKRNLTISSVILVVGIGGGVIKFGIGADLTFQLGGVALATLLGIILNLVLPPVLNKDVVEEKLSKEDGQGV